MKDKNNRYDIAKINENLKKIQQFVANDRETIDKLPTYFRIRLRFIKATKRHHLLGKMAEKPFSSDFDLEISQNTKLRQTKRNLRKDLKGNKREKKIHLFCGLYYSAIEYSNPIVQSFFEFSLFYSWVKDIELSAKKAKTIYQRAVKASLDLPLQKEEETKIFQDFLSFMQGNSARFARGTLSDYKGGRKQKDDTPEILKLMEKKNNSQIAALRLDGELSKLIKMYLSEGFTEEMAKSIAKQEFKDLRTVEMKRLAAMRSDNFPRKKTDK